METSNWYRSFAVWYDAEADTLEVRWGPADQPVARSVALNDNVMLHTEADLSALFGLTLLEYGRLLLVGETHLTGLADVEEQEFYSVMRLLATPPGDVFFVISDPDELFVRVQGPAIERLVDPTRP